MSENTASAKAKDRTKESTAKSASAARKGPVAKPSLNMDELRELAELVNEHGFTDFEFENENIRVRLSKMTAAPVMPAVQPVAMQAAAPVAATVSAPAPDASAEQTPADESTADQHTLTSPIVGTFYRSPSPDAQPHAEVGSIVKKGQTLCIIEAMKLMNEIESDVDGEVTAIYPENAQAVEFGEPLFRIKAG
jgi:acetyl-CoA carboxylase biotin carboxyl carrier protein